MSRSELQRDMLELEAKLRARRPAVHRGRRQLARQMAALPPLTWPALGLASGFLAGRSGGFASLRAARRSLTVLTLLRGLLESQVPEL
ncbi:hypothetical protein [Parahaliea aestuarii]|uniref:Uncharacterized protein n=1 Tax=Parahaliea aestuarii TaxID=1852021 RepID=A0A5C9A337_9GAMM|nr:hypothetical protein [Parahaliea aestuarii]TXS94489.1 hypothetical protein FVW59_00790 [Parahaliea aestuarii]